MPRITNLTGKIKSEDNVLAPYARAFTIYPSMCWRNSRRPRCSRDLKAETDNPKALAPSSVDSPWTSRRTMAALKSAERNSSPFSTTSRSSPLTAASSGQGNRVLTKEHL